MFVDIALVFPILFQTPPEKAFRGSKQHLLTWYLENCWKIRVGRCRHIEHGGLPFG